MSADTFSKITLVDEVTHTLKKIASKLSGFEFDRKAMIIAISAIQKATIRTRNFISEQGYKRNEELTDLWHDALNKVVDANIGEGLPDYLYQKAKFWGEPKDWIDDPVRLELVPKLSLLDEKCEMLLRRLKPK